MTKRRAIPISQAILLSILLVLCFSLGPAATAVRRPPFSTPPLASGATLFEENRGQVAPPVRYFARGLAGSVFVTERAEIVYSFLKAAPADKVAAPADKTAAPVHTGNRSRFLSKRGDGFQGWALKETFVGSLPVGLRGEEQTRARVNYFRHTAPSQWRRDIPTYNVVSFGELYQGIQLDLRARGGTVEKIFRVQPGGDPGLVRVRIDGASGLGSNKDGELEIQTGLGAVRFTQPVAYQVIDGVRRDLEVAYVVDGDRYGFRVGKYDRGAELVIDPLLAATFLGGSDDEAAYTVGVDGKGLVYVAGYTYSTNFPKTLGAYDSSYAGNSRPDAFVSKFTSDLTQLLGSTLLGGTGVDYINDLFLYHDSTTGQDFVYATGITGSEDFPTTSGAYDRILASDIPPGVELHEYFLHDAFVVKFDSDLKQLVASTLLGGDSHDEACSIHVTPQADVYVAGWFDGYGFPTTPGAAFASSAVNSDSAFVSKLDGGLTKLLASTYLGFGGRHRARAIFVKRTMVSNEYTDLVYVAGETRPANPGDFPTTAYAYDTDFNGGTTNGEGDAFVSRFNAGLTSLVASTFLGGTFDEAAWGLSVSNAGYVYVSGYTMSSDFPTTPGAFQTGLAGNMNQDAFVAKFAPDLKTLPASTYLGGDGYEAAWSIDLDWCGNVYVAGESSSSRLPADPLAFPTTPGAPDRTYNGATDAILSMFSDDLADLFFSTFVGLEKSDTSASSLPEYVPDKLDSAFAIALDNVHNNVYLSGMTLSGTVGVSPVRTQPPQTYKMFPVLPVPPQGYTVPSAYDITYNGMTDAFVAKFGKLICLYQCEARILWRNQATGQNYLWLMDGSTRRDGAWVLTIADQNWKIGGAADFNADGRTDILWRNSATGDNYVWFMDGEKRINGAWILKVADLNWKIAGVADFSGDGKADILWRHSSTGENYIWFMNGTARVGGAWVQSLPDLNWKVVGVGDFNADNLPDLVWRNSSTGEDYVWFMNGPNRTGGAWLLKVPDLNWKIGGVADFNCDGKPDILWRNSATGENYVWLMNGTVRGSGEWIMKIEDLNWQIAGAWLFTSP